MLSAKARDLRARRGPSGKAGCACGYQLERSVRSKGGRGGETRGQNAPNLGLVPFPGRVDKRVFIPQEQLLALLCILGLAGDWGSEMQAQDAQGALWFPACWFQKI